MPDDRLGDVGEAPAGDPRPHVQVDVLIEGEVALVVAAELVEQLPPQQAGGAADAEDLARRECRAAAPRPPPPRPRGRRRSGPGRRCRGGPRAPDEWVGSPSSWRMRGCTPPSSGSAQSAAASAAMHRGANTVSALRPRTRGRDPRRAEVHRRRKAELVGRAMCGTSSR